MLPDGIRILHIRDEIDFLTNEYASLDYGTFAENRMLKLSAQKSLEIIGEASSQISAELKDKYPEVPWVVISGLRNRLTHRYFDVSWPIVWEILQTDIPALKTQIEEIIREEKYGI